MFVNENAWRLLCTVVKFHVVKEAQYFVQDFKGKFDHEWQS